MIRTKYPVSLLEHFHWRIYLSSLPPIWCLVRISLKLLSVCLTKDEG
jgi:hypothetical protein